MNLDALAVKPVAYIEHHKGGDNLIWEPQKSSPPCSPLYDAAALAQVRADALEEAAVEADRWASPEQKRHGNGGPAAAIRALK